MEAKRGSGLQDGYSFPMPSDEEITDFVLSSGGGHGSIEETSSQFRIRRDETAKRATDIAAAGEVDEDWELCRALNQSLDHLPHQNSTVYGKMVWESRLEIERAGYVRLTKRGEPADFGNPHLVRFLLERVWGVKRPKLLITVTGGARDFELGNEQKDELLQGLTEAAKSVGAWFITGGTATGIMRFMGEARAAYATHVPLIGVTPWGVTKGRQSLVTDKAAASAVRFSAIAPAFYENGCRAFDKDFGTAIAQVEAKKVEEIGRSKGLDKMRKAAGLERIKKMGKDGSMSVNIDPNHSHFIFTHDHTIERFGGETAYRSQLEACISEGQDFSKQILQRLKRLGLGWEGLNFRAIETGEVEERRIPAVCVCVQGGPGTVDTVHGAVLAKTPVLLIKGSGKAADLLADSVTQMALVRSRERAGRLTQREQHLWDLLQACCEGPQGAETEGMLEALAALKTDPRLAHLVLDVLQEYEMGVHDKDPVCKADKSYELMSKILACAALPGCAVYDLDDADPAATDLNGSLLLCILNSKGHTHDLEVVTEKLLLAVMWDRPDILDKVLKQHNIRRDIKEAALARALIEALERDRVSAIHMLLEHGADFTNLELSDHSIRSKAQALVLLDREQQRQKQQAQEGTQGQVLRLFAHQPDAATAKANSEAEEKKMEEAERQKRKQVWGERIAKWRVLMKAAKDAQQSQHVLYLVAEARRKLKKDTRGKGGKYHGLTYSEWWVLKKKAKHGLKPDLSQERATGSWARRFGSLNRARVHSLASSGDNPIISEDTTSDEVASLLNLWRMESIYEGLLGPKWRYVAGMMGPAWDLFLWSVLMNRHEVPRTTPPTRSPVLQ